MHGDDLAADVEAGDGGAGQGPERGVDGDRIGAEPVRQLAPDAPGREEGDELGDRPRPPVPGRHRPQRLQRRVLDASGVPLAGHPLQQRVERRVRQPLQVGREGEALAPDDATGLGERQRQAAQLAHDAGRGLIGFPARPRAQEADGLVLVEPADRDRAAEDLEGLHGARDEDAGAGGQPPVERVGIGRVVEHDDRPLDGVEPRHPGARGGFGVDDGVGLPGPAGQFGVRPDDVRGILGADPDHRGPSVGGGRAGVRGGEVGFACPAPAEQDAEPAAVEGVVDPGQQRAAAHRRERCTGEVAEDEPGDRGRRPVPGRGPAQPQVRDERRDQGDHRTRDTQRHLGLHPSQVNRAGGAGRATEG